jgi:hypothetical protein
MSGSSSFVWAVVIAGTAGAVVACSASDASTFHDQNADTGQDTTVPSGTLGSADAGLDANADASCAPALLASYTPMWAPPKVAPGACTDQEIADAFDACFAPPIDPAKCATYKSGHATCATCVASDDKESAHGPLVWQRGGLYFTVNVAGCLAIEQGSTAADSCAATFEAAVDCKRTACDSCGSTGAVNFQSLSLCEVAAGKMGVCQMLGQKEGNTCGDLLAADAATARCFEAKGESTRDLYLRIAPLFCK